MYKVSVVDDEQAVCDRLEGLINAYGIAHGAEFEVRKFTDANAYLAAHDEESDVIFLDIDIPGMSGMDIAHKIRETRPDVIIIFCTNLQQFALNGYEVDAFGFIVKPIKEYSFDFFMDKAIKKLARMRRGGGSLYIKTVGGREMVNVRDISYVEVRRHNLFYHINKRDGSPEEVIQTRGSMQDAENQLGPFGFARCSISYLINLAHVTSIKGNDVYLAQTILPASRNHKKAFTEAFMHSLALGEVSAR